MAVSLAAIACSGDDEDEPAATLTTGAVATATATAEAASPSPEATRAGSLTPAGSATPAPSATSAGSSSQGALQTVAMFDMEPCGNATHYEEIDLPGGVPALTYKNVPAGTPILFPFERGTLRHVDPKEGAITLTYEVEDVGVVTITAAGSNSLIRNLREAVAGTVIGEFGPDFGPKERRDFQDAQLYAVTVTEELVRVGGQYYVGEPLAPQVTGCLPLP